MVVKEGGNAAGLPLRGAFVVVVVGSADNKGGGNRRDWRRHARNFVQNLTPTLVTTRRLRSRAFASLTAHKALHAKALGEEKYRRR
ncbi:MAG: hypothetical protein J0L63_11085 [Anaerolineae bacterium]|nr:hypothetical protein [Anaerolineae bacterium]